MQHAPPTRSAWLLGLVALLLFALMAIPARRAAADTPAVTVGAIFNTAATANTDVLPADITPPYSTYSIAYRMTIALVTTDSVVEVQVVSGGTTVEADLNSGTALTAGKLYTFTFGAARATSAETPAALAYNLQCETSTTVGYLLVEEIHDGSQ